jgi:hypothetical protein
MDQTDLQKLVKDIIKNPNDFLEQGNKLMEGLSPEDRSRLEQEAKKMTKGSLGASLGADLRKKLLQQGMNRRQLQKMSRTSKTMVKGKKGEAIEKGVIISESRRLKYFNIFRSQEAECVNNAVGGVGVSIPLIQRLQNSEFKDKGIKFAYNPRSYSKENRRAKKFLHVKYPIRGDIAIYKEAGSITFAEVEDIEKILSTNSELVKRDMETRKEQEAAKALGLGGGLLQGEGCVFGKTEKVRDFGNDEDYLNSSDDEDDKDEDKEKEEDKDEDSTASDSDEEIDKMMEDI